MAKKVIVGGRIESKEVGGIVTGAAEILDDTKGKKQSVINQETDAELERLDQSKQDNLTFDNIPMEGSDNPVKSGGLYTAQQAILLAIAAINELIPSAASALNKLADMAFVNSSISTNTATFRGTSTAGLTEQQFLAWANGLEHDLNDYVFWQTSDAAGNTLFKRYKWNGTEWAYEYTLNNSTFTAEQWEAIQSGITALLVTKLRALPTAQELIQSFDSKQDVLTFDNVPTLGSTNPVKSSGIFNAIKEVSDALATFINETEALIPAEATAQNQLADKADVAAKILAAIPSWKGQFDALTDLQAVTGAKAGDMGCVKTTDSDGHAVLTFYQYSAQGAWVEYYVLRHYAQNKPATTGTTGDYPYNGMGRIELQKNIVNGVNTLTQAMLTQQNTIYVIQYDFTLGEDITVPANCVLEFDGGSISASGNNDTITGNNTGIQAGLTKIFNTDVTLSGTWNVVEAYPEWFGAKGDGIIDDTTALQKTILCFSKIKLSKTYLMSGYVTIDNQKYIIGENAVLKSNTPNQFISISNNTRDVVVDGVSFIGVAEGWPTKIIGEATAAYLIKILDNCSDITIINCHFENGTGGVFVTQGGKRICVSHNTFKNMVVITNSLSSPTNATGGYGIVLHGTYNNGTSPASINDVTTDIIVSNNIFKSVGRHCLYAQVCRNVTFEGNNVFDSLINIGISSRPECVISDNGVQNFIIKNNNLYDRGSFWQYQDYSGGLIEPNIIIDGNNIILSEEEYYIFRAHMNIKNIKIINNLYKNTYPTINVFRFNGGLDNLVLNNNTVSTPLSTREVTYIFMLTSNSIFRNIFIENNNFSTVSDIFGILGMIYFGTIENLVIANNIFSGSGVSINISDITTKIEKVLICNNILKDNVIKSVQIYADGSQYKNIVAKNNIIDKEINFNTDPARNVVNDENYVIVS